MTPASAGTTPRAGQRRRGAGDDPRERGDDWSYGLVRVAHLWMTPASAGTTLYPFGTCVPAGDDPRERGDDTNATWLTSAVQG